MKPKTLGATLGWLLRSTKVLIETPWLRIRQDEITLNGKPATFTYLEHPGSVFVVPVTKEGRVVLLRSYRYNVDDWVWELPAGGVGDKGERSLEEAARDELREEAGYTGGSFERLAAFYSSVGVCDIRFTVFLARGVERTVERAPEETEQIEEVVELPLEEAVRRAQSGELNDGESALAVLLAAERVGGN
jgi:ADP-ribose pyrophosphatase